MLAGEPADLRERHLLRIVAAEAQAIARRRAPQWPAASTCAHGRDEARAIRIGRRSAAPRSRAAELSSGSGSSGAGFAMPIDEALRDQRSQPRGEAAAAVKVAKQRLARAVLFLQAEELGVERVGDLARAAARVDGVGRAVEGRPELGDEVIPRLVVANRAGAREREIRQVQRIEIAIELGRRGRAAGKRLGGAALEAASNAAGGRSQRAAPASAHDRSCSASAAQVHLAVICPRNPPMTRCLIAAPLRWLSRLKSAR